MWPGRSTLQKLLDNYDVCGWTIAVLREMSGVKGQAQFDSVESTQSCAKCICQGSVEASRLWLKIGHVGLGK